MQQGSFRGVKGPISRLQLTQIRVRDDVWLCACFKQILKNFRDVIQVGDGAIVSRGNESRPDFFSNGVTTAALYLVGNTPCSNDRLA